MWKGSPLSWCTLGKRECLKQKTSDKNPHILEEGRIIYPQTGLKQFSIYFFFFQCVRTLWVIQGHMQLYSSKTKEACYPPDCLKGSGPCPLGSWQLLAPALLLPGHLQYEIKFPSGNQFSYTLHLILQFVTLGNQISPSHLGELYGKNMKISSNSYITRYADSARHYMLYWIPRDSYKCERTYPTTAILWHEKHLSQLPLCHLPLPPLRGALLPPNGC